MTAERWARIKSAFDAAADLPPAERSTVIASACQDDPTLRSEIERLLALHDMSSSFLDTPAGNVPTPGLVLAPGELLGGRFLVRRLLGQGGMGQVYEAFDNALDDEIAIKLLRAQAASDIAHNERFRREVQTARRISHPNVCRVFDLFEESVQGAVRTFLTMELLDGETLADRIQRGPLDLKAALPLLRQLAAGLDAAHAVGVVHRDLKPGNIMLLEGRAVITDFGLARNFQQPKGEPRWTVAGTPAYMAPEQFVGDAVTPATDVYALGIVIYEMLTGSLPSQSGNPVAGILRRVREKPKSLPSSCPAHWNAVIAQCLAFNPEDRPQRAGEVLNGLERPAALSRRSWAKWLVPAGATSVFASLWLWLSREADSPPPAAAAWRTEANEALADGAFVRAAGLFRRALELSPQYPLAHAGLAEALFELDMPEQARESVLRALETNTSRLPQSEASYVSAVHKTVLRDVKGAAEAFRRRVSLVATDEKVAALIALARADERADQVDRALLALADAARIDPRRGAVPLRRGLLEARRRNYSPALSAFEEAAHLYRLRGDYEGVGEVLYAQGSLAVERDDLAAASRALDEAASTARTTGSLQQQVRVELSRAIVARKRGEVELADRITTAALDAARKHDLEGLTLQALFMAANVHLVRYELLLAVQQFEQALSISTRLKHELNIARARLSLASAHIRLCEPDTAASLLATAIPYYERSGHHRNVSIGNALLGQVRQLRAEYPAAARQFQGELQLAEQKGDPEQEIIARENLATTLAEMGSLPEAIEHYQIALRRHNESGKRFNEAYAHLALAEYLGRLGRRKTADEHLREGQKMAAVLDRSPAALHSRAQYVSGLRALYDGRSGEAAGVAAALLRNAAGLPAQRAFESRLLLAAASLARNRRAESLEHARTVRAECERRGVRGLLFLGWLLEAAAQLDGTPSQSIELAGRALSAMQVAGMIESPWKASAIRAAAAARLNDRSLRQSAAGQMTRELEILRMKWGDSDFRTYLERADVKVFRSLVPL